MVQLHMGYMLSVDQRVEGVAAQSLVEGAMLDKTGHINEGGEGGGASHTQELVVACSRIEEDILVIIHPWAREGMVTEEEASMDGEGSHKTFHQAREDT